MANKRWLGRAGAVAEVNTITIALTWAAGDTITVTINAKDLLVTIGTLVTTAQVATTLKQAWEGETFTDTTATVRPAGGGPDFTEYAEITATVSGSVGTLTGDTGGVGQTALLIESTGSAAEVGIGGVVWKGTHASNSLRLQDGSVSISAFNGEPAALLTAEVTNGTLVAGPGFTAPLGPLTIQAGNVTMRDNVTTVTIADGTLTLLGTATVTTLNLDGGTFIHKSSGAITTAQE